MGDSGSGKDKQNFSETLSSSASELASGLADRFGVVRSSRKMLRMVDYARGVAGTRYPVLIQGEVGTGKERFARGIHELSQRSGAFIPVDCGAIPEESFESELFGQAASAGVEAKTGLVQAAASGTLYIHGIDQMPKHVQVKFLRLLRDGELMPKGANNYEHVDVRVIATTSRELEDLAESGQFNRTLLVELSTAIIRLPSLREREDDLFVLFTSALEAAAREVGCEVPEVEPEVYQMIRDYSWPENIRELNQAVIAAVVRAKGRPLKARHFASIQERMDKLGKEPAQPVQTDGNVDPSLDEIRPLFVELQEFERSYIDRLLKKCNNNISKAAEIAAVTRTTVREKARQYGLRGGDPGGSPEGGPSTTTTQRQRIRTH